jgi:uncharacterized protein (TIGR02145 family)
LPLKKPALMKTQFILLLCVIIGTGTSTFSQTVTIGKQEWMTENLNVDKFRNGDPIPEAKTNGEWELASKNKQPAWCYYNNDPQYGAKYGKLYNWYAVTDPRGLAPVGYHVPSDAEWTKLTDFLGGESVAGEKMKSTSGWDSYTTGGSKNCPNCANWNAEYRRKVPCNTCQDTRFVPVPKVPNSGNGSNTSGFSGLPGGFHSGYDGTFERVGQVGYWWSSTEDDTDEARYRALDHDDVYVGSRYHGDKSKGGSVRCLKD